MTGASAPIAGRAAGLAAIGVLHAYWFLQPVPLGFKGLAAALAVVSIANPAWGLVAFAALAPLSTPIADFCGAYGLGFQLLEQMALAIAAGTLLRGGLAGVRTRIGWPAAMVALVAGASAATLIAGAILTAAPNPTGGTGLLLEQLFDRRGAQASTMWAPLFAAGVVGVGALLGWSSERLVRRQPDLAARFVLVSLLGHAGAALLNVLTTVRLAVRSGDVVGSLPSMLMTERISVQTDVHAAASAFLLAGVAGLGLLSGSWARRTTIAVPLMIVAAGLWITGSRVAMLLGIVAVAVAIAWSAIRAGRQRIVVAAAAILLIAATAWLTTLYPSGRYNTTAGSINSRLILTRAGIQLFNQAPVFGIGVAKFYGASAAFISPTEARIVGYSRENAHNNFLQVLAEQGLLGFAALLWWLAVVLAGGRGLQAASPGAPGRALVMAIVACMGTWLAGHPLLVPEFAFVFWIYCGILAALPPVRPQDRNRWLMWALAAFVILSVPPRAVALRNAADLEHVGSGLSALWQHDDAQRYREAGAAFSLFLPAGERPVEVPVRRAPGAPEPIVVDARIGDRLIATITVSGDAWHAPLLAIPKGPRRFELVEFRVRPQASGINADGILLRVGRDSVR
jgi:hypothetical protein